MNWIFLIVGGMFEAGVIPFDKMEQFFKENLK